MQRKPLVVGTRASALALVQTGMVVTGLQLAHPGLACEVQPIRTHGDQDVETPLAQLGGLGVFVRELEKALLAGEVDLAVHSLKDMPTIEPPGLTIAAVLPREDPRDALVSRGGLRLEELPPGARVGTGSLRRAAQLKALRPDLETVGLRGNVDTRLRKVAGGECDAIVLAMAGLIRLGRAAEAIPIPLDMMLPAVGQGAIAVEARADDAETLALLRPLDDPATHAATDAERSLLRELGGGCHVPIAAHATVDGGELWLQGLVASISGERMVRGSARGRLEQAEEVGRGLARQLIAGGCAELLVEEATRA